MGKVQSLSGHQVTVAGRVITVTVTATQTAFTLSQSAVPPSRACPHGTLRSAPLLWLQHTAVETTLTRGLLVAVLILLYLYFMLSFVVLRHFTLCNILHCVT